MVEALVALLLTAIALAGLTAAAAAGLRHTRLACDRVSALELAAARLEGLRAGPRASDADEVVSAGTRFARTWQAGDGRGGPARLRVEVTWTDGHVVLESEAFP